MPATTQPHLEITDGTTSIKFMDSSAATPIAIAAMPYKLSYGGWAPKIARRNSNPLGLPYLPVREELTIDIHGATAADCYNRLQVLNTLIDQGERWYNNEIVPVVLFKFQPLGSTKTVAMQDVIIGGGTDDRNSDLVALPNDFNSVGLFFKLKGIVISFMRRAGLWLAETETQSVSAVAQDVPMTVTWSDFAPVLSPVDIEIGGNSASDNITSGFTLVAHDADWIKVLLGTSGAGSGANTNDAASFPTGAQIRRFTGVPTATLAWSTLSTMPIQDAEYFAVYAKVRNNSTTIDVKCRVDLVYPVRSGSFVRVAAAASPLPQVVFMGLFATRGRPPGNVAGDEIQFYAEALSGNLNFDLDSIAIVLINRASNVIAGQQVTHFTIASDDQVQILHRLLIEPQGLYAVNEPPADIPQLHTGSPYCFTGASGTVKQTAVLEYFTDGGAWTILNSARGAKITLDLRATRTKAYLVPE